MKGPLDRLKYDTRRLWVCPVCESERLLPGSVTDSLCNCMKPHPRLLLRDVTSRSAAETARFPVAIDEPNDPVTNPE